jgi:hypothetical protein
VFTLKRTQEDWVHKSKECLKDTTFVKARVGLARKDRGYKSGSADNIPTELSLEKRVYAFSEGLDSLKGNTPPIVGSEQVTVVPSKIFPTSPFIGCNFPTDPSTFIDPDLDFLTSSLPAGHSRIQHLKQTSGIISVSLYRGVGLNMSASDSVDSASASAYRSSRQIVDYLVTILSTGGGKIEPVDAELWPGDLAALAHSKFPPSVRQSTVRLEEFIRTCLLDAESVSDDEILTLAGRVFPETASRWTTFATWRKSEGADTSGDTVIQTFGREARHALLRGNQDKMRCAVTLSDGCEESHEIKGSVEVQVQSLHLKNVSDGHEFEAGTDGHGSQGVVNITVVGAGFVAGRSDYVCEWSQPSREFSTFQETSNGKAVSSTEIICTLPKWQGMTGSTELTLTGPILEYQGCFDTKVLVKHLDDSSPADFAFQFGAGLSQHNPGYDPVYGESLRQRPYTLSGLYSCQLQATTEATAKAEVHNALKGHGGAVGAGLFALSAKNDVSCERAEWIEVQTTLVEETKTIDKLKTVTTYLYPCNTPEANATGASLANETCYDPITEYYGGYVFTPEIEQAFCKDLVTGKKAIKDIEKDGKFLNKCMFLACAKPNPNGGWDNTCKVDTDGTHDFIQDREATCVHKETGEKKEGANTIRDCTGVEFAFTPEEPAKCKDSVANILTTNGTREECTGLTGYTFFAASSASCKDSDGNDTASSISETACTDQSDNVYNANDHTCKNSAGSIIGFGRTGKSASEEACRGVSNGNTYTPAALDSCKDADGNDAGDASDAPSCEGSDNGLNRVYIPKEASVCSDGRTGVTQKQCTGHPYAKPIEEDKLVPVEVTRQVPVHTDVQRNETRCIWNGCSYVQGRSPSETRTPAEVAAQLSDMMQERLWENGGRVSDDKCNAPCPTPSPASSALHHSPALALAQDLDGQQPQVCGSADGRFASVFSARREHGIRVGNFFIKSAQPDPPRWREDGLSVSKFPGKVALSWQTPEFLGGKQALKYEVQFKLAEWESMFPLADNDIAYATSHAMMCPLDFDSEGVVSRGATDVLEAMATPTRGLDIDSNSQVYRVCGSGEYDEESFVDSETAYDNWFETVRPRPNGGSNHTTALDVGRSTNATIGYLNPTKLYEFRIRVYTEHGWSSWSETVKAQAAAIVRPGPVRELNLDASTSYSDSVTSSSLRLRFRRPASDGGVFLSHYKISLEQVNCEDSSVPVESQAFAQGHSDFLDPGSQTTGGDKLAYTIVPAAVETITLDSLDANKPYRITVRAVNARGMVSNPLSTAWTTRDDTARTINVGAETNGTEVTRLIYDKSSASYGKNWHERRNSTNPVLDHSSSHKTVVDSCAEVDSESTTCESLMRAMNVANEGAEVPSTNNEGKHGRSIVLAQGYHQAPNVEVKIGNLRIQGAVAGSPEHTVITCGTYGLSGRDRGRCFTSGSMTLSDDLGGGIAFVFLHSLRDVTLVPVKRVLAARDANAVYDEVGDSPRIGGALLINGVQHPVTISDVIFANFSASYLGGAVVIMDSNAANQIHITRSLFVGINVGTFVGSNIGVDTFGGAVAIVNALVGISDSTFRGNGGSHLVQYGGAIAVTTHEYLQDALSNERVLPDDFITKLRLTGGGFYDNTAVLSGGAVFVAQGTLHISGVQFGDRWAHSYTAAKEATCPNPTGYTWDVHGNCVNPAGPNDNSLTTKATCECVGQYAKETQTVVGYCDDGSANPQARNYYDQLGNLRNSLGLTAYGFRCGGDSNGSVPSTFSSEVAGETAIEAAEMDDLMKVIAEEANQTNHTLSMITSARLISKSARTLSYRAANLKNVRGFLDEATRFIDEIVSDTVTPCPDSSESSRLVTAAKDIKASLLPSMSDDFTQMSLSCDILADNLATLKNAFQANPALATLEFIALRDTRADDEVGESSYCKKICEANCPQGFAQCGGFDSLTGNVYTPSTNISAASCTNGGNATSEALCTGKNTSRIFSPSAPSNCSDGTEGGTLTECTGLTGYTFTPMQLSKCDNGTNIRHGVTEEECTGMTGLTFVNATASLCSGGGDTTSELACTGLTGYTYTAATCGGGCHDSAGNEYTFKDDGEFCLNPFAPGFYRAASCSLAGTTSPCEAMPPAYLNSDSIEFSAIVKACKEIIPFSAKGFVGTKYDCEGRHNGRTFTSGTPKACLDANGNLAGDDTSRSTCEGTRVHNIEGLQVKFTSGTPQTCTDNHGNRAGDNSSKSACEGTASNYTFTKARPSECNDGTLGGLEENCTRCSCSEFAIQEEEDNDEADVTRDFRVDVNQSAWLDYYANETISGIGHGGYFEKRMHWLEQTVQSTCPTIKTAALNYKKQDRTEVCNVMNVLECMSVLVDKASDLAVANTLCSDKQSRLKGALEQLTAFLDREDDSMTSMDCTGNAPTVERSCTPQTFADADGFALSGVSSRASVCSDGRRGLSETECTGLTHLTFTPFEPSSCSTGTTGETEAECLKGATGNTFLPIRPSVCKASSSHRCSDPDYAIEIDGTERSCTGVTGYTFTAKVEASCTEGRKRFPEHINSRIECEGYSTGNVYVPAKCENGCAKSDPYDEDSDGKWCKDGFTGHSKENSTSGMYTPPKCLNESGGIVDVTSITSWEGEWRGAPSDLVRRQECEGNETNRVFAAEVEKHSCKDVEGNDKYAGTMYDCQGLEPSDSEFEPPKVATCKDSEGQLSGDNTDRVACTGITGNNLSDAVNGTCATHSGVLVPGISSKDECDGKTEHMYVKPSPWNVCSNGCQFGRNESKQDCDGMDGGYTFIAAGHARCVNAAGIDVVESGPKVSKIQCEGAKTNNTWIVVKANCTSANGDLVWSEEMDVWTSSDASKSRDRCEGIPTGFIYAAPELSRCNSPRPGSDYMHFLEADLDLEMALLDGLILKYPNLDQKLPFKERDSDGNIEFGSSSDVFSKDLYETVKVACERVGPTSNYTMDPRDSSNYPKCRNNIDGSLKKGYLHFLSVSVAYPSAKDKLAYEMKLRKEVDDVYDPSKPQWEWHPRVVDIMQKTCEGSTTNASYTRLSEGGRTCLDALGAYRGTINDCEGEHNQHVYIPRRDQMCVSPEGVVLDSGITTNKRECEGDTTVRTFTPAIEATCKDAEGNDSGNSTSSVMCEGEMTGHTFLPSLEKDLVTERSTEVTEATIWPCAGEASGAVPVLTTNCEAGTGISQNLDMRARGIVAVSELMLAEESARAHTLNAVWNEYVDKTIRTISDRRKTVLHEAVTHGAYLGHLYLKEYYFYDRFYEVFGRASAPNLQHGVATGFQVIAFKSTSAHNRVTVGDGGSLSMRSGATVTIDSGSRFVNSVTTWGVGGGIQCLSATLNVIGSIFKYNSGLEGGAIYAKNCVVDLSYGSEFQENTAYRDGGALFLGLFTKAQIDSASLRQNKVNCPTKPFGVTVCPEWKDTIVGIPGTLDAFCIHPSCQSYTGGGGAVYVDDASEVVFRRSNFEKNKAPRGGAVFVRNTLDFNIRENSKFVENTCERPLSLVNAAQFDSGGGAIYLQLSRFMLLDTRPSVRDTSFVRNSVVEGSGGAIFWEVVPPMIPQLNDVGGLLRFKSGYDASIENLMSNNTKPLAYENSALWGGQFIGSSAFSLTIIDGPARYASSFVSSAKPCGAEVCPFHCSGAAEFKGQQCVSRSMTVETMAKPATVWGGVPIADAIGAEEIRVAVVDFYNNIVESASEIVFVEAAVNFAKAGLGDAYPGTESKTNCSEQGWTGNLKRPEICSYLLSPATVAVGAVEGSSASQAAVRPVRGIAVFSDLMLHAEPSDICYEHIWVSSEPGAVEGDPVEGMDTNVARRRVLQADAHSIELEATTRPGPRKRELRGVHARDELPRFRGGRRRRRRMVDSDASTVCTPKLYDLVVTSVGNVGALVEGKPALAVSVSDCPPGTWLDKRRDNMRCTPCLPGRYATSKNFNIDGANALTVHSIPSFFNSKDPCWQCEAGLYQNEASQTGCKACSEGQFSDEPERTKCKECVIGTFTDGRTGSVGCIGCPKGKFGEKAGLVGNQFTRCRVCPAGRFQPIGFNAFWNVTTNSVDTPNSYVTTSSNEMSWECHACPMGYMQYVSGSTECINCPDGLVSPAEETACLVKCPAGTFRDEKQYPKWKHEKDTMRRGLSVNRRRWETDVKFMSKLARHDNLDMCEYCPHLRPSCNCFEVLLCAACPEGWHNPDTEAKECTLCELGKSQSRKRKDSCDDCTAGQYSAHKGVYECTACKSGLYQHKSGQDNCIGCETGLYTRSQPLPEYYKFVKNDDREHNVSLANGGAYWLKAADAGSVDYREKRWDLVDLLKYVYTVKKLYVDKNALVTAWHTDTYLNPALQAGNRVKITGFVQSSWANGEWTVVGNPNATSFQFSAKRILENVSKCDLLGVEHRDIAKTVSLQATAALQADSEGATSFPHAVGLNGTFILSVDGEPTEALRYDASAEDVKNALENIDTDGIDKVSVYRDGDGGPESCESMCMYGFRWDITFHNYLGRKQPVLKAISNVIATKNQLKCSIWITLREIQCKGAYDGMVILEGQKVRISRGENQSFHIFTSEESRERDNFDVASGRSTRILTIRLSFEQQSMIKNLIATAGSEDNCDEDEDDYDMDASSSDDDNSRRGSTSGWSASVVELRTDSHTIPGEAVFMQPGADTSCAWDPKEKCLPPVWGEVERRPSLHSRDAASFPSGIQIRNPVSSTSDPGHISIGEDVMALCVKITEVEGIKKDSKALTLITGGIRRTERCNILRLEKDKTESLCPGWFERFKPGKIVEIKQCVMCEQRGVLGGVLGVVPCTQDMISWFTADGLGNTTCADDPGQFLVRYQIPVKIISSDTIQEWPVVINPSLAQVGASVNAKDMVALAFNPLKSSDRTQKWHAKSTTSLTLDKAVEVTKKGEDWYIDDQIFAVGVYVPEGGDGVISSVPCKSCIANKGDAIVFISQDKRSRVVKKMVPDVTEVRIWGTEAKPRNLRKKCGKCSKGRWTGYFGSGRSECRSCPLGWKGVDKKDDDRIEPHREYASCDACSVNQVSNVLEGVSCEPCVKSSWTSRMIGQTSCTACVQGEIFYTSDEQIERLKVEPTPSLRDCVNCPGVDEDIAGDRGTYSFVAGGSSCRECAPGRVCHGGAVMSTEWGWWVSNGAAAHRKKVQDRMIDEATKGRYPINKEPCEAEYGESVAVANVSERTALQSESTVDVSLSSSSSLSSSYGTLTSVDKCNNLTDSGCLYAPAECNDPCRGPEAYFFCKSADSSERIDCTVEEAASMYDDGDDEFASCTTRTIGTSDGGKVSVVLCRRNDEFVDPDCACKQSSADGPPDCRYWCDVGEELRGGVFMDQCGLPRKVTRCPGYQKQITCEMRFRELWREYVDLESTSIEIDRQCRACRPTKLHVVRPLSLKVNVELMTNLGIYRHAVVDDSSIVSVRPQTDTGIGMNSGNKTVAGLTESVLPVDVLWLFGEANNDDESPWMLRNILHQDTLDGGEWPLLVVNYNVPHAGTWDTGYYSYPKWKMNPEWDRELTDIYVALLPNDQRIPAMMEVDSAAYYTALRSALSEMRGDETVDEHNRLLLSNVCLILTKGKETSSSKSKQLLSTHCRILLSNSTDRVDGPNNEDCLRANKLSNPERRRRLVSSSSSTISGADVNASDAPPAVGAAAISGGNGQMYVGASDCNHLAGYYGRLCSKCLPGFTGSPRPIIRSCSRCAPYSVCVTTLIGGVFMCFIVAMVCILAVVVHAGTSSTSTVTKRIIATHLQTIALLLNFDLNWNTNLLEFFSMAGYVSAIGEGLIPTGCYLGYHSHELPFAPFYITTLIFIGLPLLLMVPGAIYLIYKTIRIYCAESSSERRDNKETRHLVTVLRQIKLAELHKELADKDGDGNLTEDEAREAKVQRIVRSREKKRTRKEYNTLIHALQKASAEDKKLHHEGHIDHLAIGRMKARELVEHVRMRKLNMRALFKEFRSSESELAAEDSLGKKKKKKKRSRVNARLLEVHSADFLLILKTMRLGWTEEEYMDIVELLSQPGRAIKENPSAKTKKRGEPRVTFKHLMSFETTLQDKIIVMATVVCFILYPTIARKIFQSFACLSGLMDGDSNWYLHSDLDISCTSPSHIAFIICVCIPVIIVYVIGFPATIIFLIWHSKKRHGRLSEKTQFRFAVFISGYSKRYWFWEGVTSARKVLLIIIAVFLGSYGPERQFFFASLLLVCTCVVQLHVKPFENKSLNALETSGIGFLWLTVYFGIFFYWQLLTNAELNWLGFVIVFMNVSFVWWAIGYLIGEYLALHPEARWIQGGFLAPACMNKLIDCGRNLGKVDPSSKKGKSRKRKNKKKLKPATTLLRDKDGKVLRRRVCNCTKTKQPFYLILLSVPTLLLLIVMSFKSAFKAAVALCGLDKSAGKVSDAEILNPLALMKVQIQQMKEAIGIHIKEMQELALKKEKEMYKAKLRMLNVERMREQKLRDEQEALNINTRKAKSFDMMAKTGIFAHKVAIIRKKREMRDERKKRNEELEKMGIQAPTEEDDGLYDFLNGGLLDQVIEAGGEDDEMLSTGANDDEELQELFNFGGVKETLDADETEDNGDEVDLDAMFSAPNVTITPNLDSGGFDLDASDSDDSDLDAMAELENELLFLDDEEKKTAIKESEEERSAKLLRDANAREAELLARIRALEGGIEELNTEIDLDDDDDGGSGSAAVTAVSGIDLDASISGASNSVTPNSRTQSKMNALNKAKMLSRKFKKRSKLEQAREERKKMRGQRVKIERSQRNIECVDSYIGGDGSDTVESKELTGLLSSLDDHIDNEGENNHSSSRRSLGSRMIANSKLEEPSAPPRPTRLPKPAMMASGAIKFCGNCGQKQGVEAIFCGSCGSRF